MLFGKHSTSVTLHNRFRLNVARCRKKITDCYRNRQPSEFFSMDWNLTANSLEPLQPALVSKTCEDLWIRMKKWRLFFRFNETHTGALHSVRVTKKHRIFH